MTAPLRLILVAAAALIDQAGRVLVAQRPAGKQLAGLWEFPGGKIEQGERPEAALVRELHEELGLSLVPEDLAAFAFASFPYPDFHLLMPLWVVRRWHGEPHGREGQAVKWVDAQELQALAMPPADGPLVTALLPLLTGASSRPSNPDRE
jgi:8-oxo-dGTP diphosphatase